MQTTDIVMDTTGNRLPLLRRSIEALLERTVMSYSLHVIDDASSDGTAKYLLKLWKKGRIAKPVLRKKRLGIPANWNLVPVLGKSKIVVYTNGDVLCPKVNPDWLTQGLKVLDTYPDLGMLSLNSPMCNAKKVLKILDRRPGVVICDRVPSFFLFVRRALMQKIVIPSIGGKMAGLPIVSTYVKIDRVWSRMAQKHGFKVGYLAGVYCQHIGLHSVRNNRDLSPWSVERLNPETLEPPKGYRG